MEMLRTAMFVLALNLPIVIMFIHCNKHVDNNCKKMDAIKEEIKELLGDKTK